MSVRIVTDSTSDPTPELLRQYRIVCVPLNVHFGMESYKDRVTLDSATFFDRLEKSHEMPRTSLPSPGEFAEAYQPLVDEGSEVVSLHLSSQLSGTYGSAATAAREFGGKVKVVDTGHVSASMFLLVQAAARAAASGASADEIVALIDREKSKARLFFAVSTLDYLQRGGRIGKAEHLLGNLLDVKPILTINGGMIEACAKARTRRKAVERALELLGESGPVRDAVVCHARAPQESAAVLECLHARFPTASVQETEMGPVVGAYAGPGCIAVAGL